MATCEDCKLEDRVKALESDCKRNSDAHQRFYDSFKELEKRDAVTEERYSTILSTMAGMKTAIEELKSKPGKRWENVVEKVILLVVAGGVGWLLAQVGIAG